MAIVIPYTRQTWTDGSGGGTPVSAARLAVIEEGIVDVSQGPAVRAFHSAIQSITNATLTALAFDSERFDQAGGVASTMHDTVTNNSRLTCRYAGIYLITGNVVFATNATGIRASRIRLNGVTNIGTAGSPAAVGTDDTPQTVSTLYSLAVNDYVELIVFQNSGGALNLNVVANMSPEFMMTRVA